MQNHTQVTPPMGSATAQANNPFDNIRQLAAQGEALSHAFLSVIDAPAPLPQQHVTELQLLILSLFKKINEEV